MKRYSLKLILFTFPCISLWFFFEINLSKVKNSYNVKARQIELVKDSIEVLVLGSSREYFGVNPDYITHNTFNLANTSQSLYYDCRLLQKYYKKLPKLKLVIIPISYFSFESTIETSKEYWRKYYYNHFFEIKPEMGSMGVSDIRAYSLFALYEPGNAWSYMLKNFQMNLSEHTHVNGWYEVSKEESNLITNESAKARALDHTNSMMKKNIGFNIKQMEDMLNLLSKNRIKAVLLTTPVTDLYFDNLDEIKRQRMFKLVNDLSLKFNVRYCNYLNDRRFELSDFSDSDHLNPKGAQKMSAIINNEVVAYHFNQTFDQ